MYENNKDIGWKKKNNNNNGSNYDDSLIKNQINILDNKIDEEIEEVNSQLAHVKNELNDLTYILTPSGEDDTAYIQEAIDKYKHIILDGGTFICSINPETKMFIKMKGDTILEFRNKSKICIKNTNSNYYQVINCDEIDNFSIINPHIIGDNLENTNENGQWGHGIKILGCKNWFIENYIGEHCQGDAISIGNKEYRKSEYGYINNIVAIGNGRQGVTIAGGKNVTIDRIYAECANDQEPYCGLDIESNVKYDFFENIVVRNVYTKNCYGGVHIAPFGYAETVDPPEINIRIDNITIEGNDDCIGLRLWGFENTSGEVILNNVVVKNTREGLYVTRIPSSTKVIINNLVCENTGLVVENTADGSTSASIKIQNVNNSGMGCEGLYINNCIINQKEDTKVSIAINDINSNKEKIGYIRNIKSNKPYFISTPNNLVLDGDVIFNMKDSTQSWATYHNFANIYTNKGIERDYTFSPSSTIYSGFPTTVKCDEDGKYIGVKYSSIVSIYPTSLGFTKGFKSNKKGSKIKYILNDDLTIDILEIVGEWEDISQ